MNHMFRGAFPITAMALDAESKMLVLSVGPSVFHWGQGGNYPGTW